MVFIVRGNGSLEFDLGECVIGRDRQVLRFHRLRWRKVPFKGGIVLLDFLQCRWFVKFDHLCVALWVNVLCEEVIDKHCHFSKVGLGRRFGWIAGRVKRVRSLRVL